MMNVEQLYQAWQSLEREVDRIMDQGGHALDVRTDAAIAKEAYLRAEEKANAI